jgi:MFS family permease
VLLTALPFTVAAAAAVAVGHSSQRRGEQRWHICAPLLLGGCVFSLLPLAVGASVPLGFLCLTFALVAADATTGPLWAWVQAASPGETIVVSFAFVNSLGKVGGFVGPYLFGLLVHWMGSYVPSVLFISAALVLGGLLAWGYPHGGGQQHRYRQLQEAELVVQQ